MNKYYAHLFRAGLLTDDSTISINTAQDKTSTGTLHWLGSFAGFKPCARQTQLIRLEYIIEVTIHS